ncbi:MAG: Rrf2 family transcriptional regulator [Deltaproteobacteria bacterium]|nr:Rrf2 family transcriptional regulator [Deltaproteobacteria bacterium]
MRLSTRSRYGTRMMIELAGRYDNGPVQIGEIAARQGISVKYLEQLIIPLKKANYVKSVRGRKGGHMLAKPPEEITIGEIVELLEGGINLSECIENPEICDRSETCLTRGLWETATGAMSRELNAITLSDMIKPKDRQPNRRSKGRKKSFQKK